MTASNDRVPAVHTEEPCLVNCNKPLFAFFVVISMAILRAYFPVEPLFGESFDAVTGRFVYFQSRLTRAAPVNISMHVAC